MSFFLKNISVIAILSHTEASFFDFKQIFFFHTLMHPYFFEKHMYHSNCFHILMRPSITHICHGNSSTHWCIIVWLFSPLSHDNTSFFFEKKNTSIIVQPIVDWVARNLEIIFQSFSTNQNSIHGIYDKSKVINDKSHKNPGTPGTNLKVLRNNLKILCHPICNWL